MTSKTHKLHDLQLTKTQETLFATLYARALDHRSRHSLLHDTAADVLAKAIDVDYAKMEGLSSDHLIVIRTKHYDDWLREFLAQHPNAVVVNLGCGLDTRINRLKPDSKMRWFDVDYPDVIRLREHFYANREGYRMIGASVTDPDWLEKIPGDRPAFIIAEELLEYLAEAEVKTLFHRLLDHFDHGQIIFDVVNSYAAQSAQSNRSDGAEAIHHWAVDNRRTFERVFAKSENSPFCPHP